MKIITCKGGDTVLMQGYNTKAADVRSTETVKKKTNFDLIIRFLQTDSGYSMLPYESGTLKNLITVYLFHLSFHPSSHFLSNEQFDKYFNKHLVETDDLYFPLEVNLFSTDYLCILYILAVQHI